MTISLLNAIKNVKQDPHWIKKIVILAVIVYFIPFIIGLICGLAGCEKNIANIISGLTGLIVGLYFVGFQFSTGNKYLTTDNNTMAELGEKNLLLLGLKQIFSTIIYAIILAIPFTLIALVFVFVCSFFIKLSLSGVGANNILMSILLAILATIIYTVIFLFILQFVNAAFCSFAKTLKIKCMLSLIKHFKMIKENQHVTWSLIGKEILYTMLFTLLALALCVSIVGIILVPFVCVYAYLVSMNLIAQYGKEIQIERYFE